MIIDCDEWYNENKDVNFHDNYNGNIDNYGSDNDETKIIIVNVVMMKIMTVMIIIIVEMMMIKQWFFKWLCSYTWADFKSFFIQIHLTYVFSEFSI